MARRNRASVSRRTSSPRRTARTRGCFRGVATSTVTQNITPLRMRELLVPPSNDASRLTWELRQRVTSSPKLEAALARSAALDDKWRRFSQSRVHCRRGRCDWTPCMQMHGQSWNGRSRPPAGNVGSAVGTQHSVEIQRHFTRPRACSMIGMLHVIERDASQNLASFSLAEDATTTGHEKEAQETQGEGARSPRIKM